MLLFCMLCLVCWLPANSMPRSSPWVLSQKLIQQKRCQRVQHLAAPTQLTAQQSITYPQSLQTTSPEIYLL